MIIIICANVSDPGVEMCAYSPGIVTSAAVETSLNIPRVKQLSSHECTDSTESTEKRNITKIPQIGVTISILDYCG
jgi:hypothetical protein